MTMMATFNATAQPTANRPFTLDDLIPGGATFYQASYPETMYTTWWGERLMEQDMDEVREIRYATCTRSSSPMPARRW